MRLAVASRSNRCSSSQLNHGRLLLPRQAVPQRGNGWGVQESIRAADPVDQPTLRKLPTQAPSGGGQEWPGTGVIRQVGGTVPEGIARESRGDGHRDSRSDPGARTVRRGAANGNFKYHAPWQLRCAGRCRSVWVSPRQCFEIVRISARPAQHSPRLNLIPRRGSRSPGRRPLGYKDGSRGRRIEPGGVARKSPHNADVMAHQLNARSGRVGFVL